MAGDCREKLGLREEEKLHEEEMSRRRRDNRGQPSGLWYLSSCEDAALERERKAGAQEASYIGLALEKGCRAFPGM